MNNIENIIEDIEFYRNSLGMELMEKVFEGEMTFENLSKLNLYRYDNITNKIVIFDISECTYMDSAFVGYLLQVKSNLEKEDKNLFYIKNPNDMSKNVLKLINLGKYFEKNLLYSEEN